MLHSVRAPHRTLVRLIAPTEGKPRHNFLYTSSELSRLKRWSPPLCGMNEFEKPQLLSGKGELHLAHHRLGAIEHQGFLRIQRDQ